jgi:ABC-type multidrug transport system ATPase subunit
MKNIIDVSNLTFAYKKHVLVLDNIGIAVADGEFVALLGHNGAGKTTLLKLIIGMLKQSQGEIKIDKTLITQRKDIFLLSEDGGLYRDMTIAENIIYRTLLFSDEKISANQLVRGKLVNQFKLTKHLNKKITELSSGLRKRAALVVGLLFEPKLLLLDEPTNSIDPKTRAMFKEYLLAAKAKGNSAIVVTHDLDFAFDTCDTAILLNENQIIQRKPLSDYQNFNEFENEYLKFTEEHDEDDSDDSNRDRLKYEISGVKK